jgi:hypothetical protein
MTVTVYGTLFLGILCFVSFDLVAEKSKNHEFDRMDDDHTPRRKANEEVKATKLPHIIRLSPAFAMLYRIFPFHKTKLESSSAVGRPRCEQEWLEIMKVRPIESLDATPLEASNSKPPSVSATRNSSSCTQPHKAAEGPPPLLAHSCQGCSPLQEFLCGVKGVWDLTYIDIVQDNAKCIRPQNSSSHLEAWKVGCSKEVSDSVIMKDPTPNTDDLMDPEEEDLVRQMALRFDSAGQQAAMAPKIPQRRTSYEAEYDVVCSMMEIPWRRTSYDKERDVYAMSAPRIPQRRASYEEGIVAWPIQ